MISPLRFDHSTQPTNSTTGFYDHSKVQAAAGGYLCISGHETEDGGSAQAIKIFSKELSESDKRTGVLLSQNTIISITFQQL